MAFDGDCHSIAQRALELELLAPLVEHDASECEMCADYQKEIAAREAELEELQREPSKKNWLR